MKLQDNKNKASRVVQQIKSCIKYCSTGKKHSVLEDVYDSEFYQTLGNSSTYSSIVHNRSVSFKTEASC